VQRLFERRWIGVLAGRIANPLKGTGKEVQSVGKNAFIKLISNVVRMLKTSGYSVEIPKEKRLELLWADRLKGGWSSEW